MGMYRIEWSCGDVSYTDSYAPEKCPFCKLALLEELVKKAGLEEQVEVNCEPCDS